MQGHPFRCLRGKQTTNSVFVARFPMSAAAAEAWFEAASSGDLRLPSHPAKKTPGDDQLLGGPPFRREPENGSMSSAMDLPFLPAVHGVMLACGLFGTDDQKFFEEINKKPLLEWLQDNIFIDIARYPEYLGSLIMVRHPLVVRDVGSRLGFTNSREVEMARIRRWPGTNLTGCKIVAFDQRFLGISLHRELFLDSSVVELDWNGKSNKTALVVTHPVNGLAWWREPAGFLRSIQMTLDLVHETRRITQSIDKEGKIDQHYDVGWRGSGNTSVISLVGDETDGQHPGNRAWRGEARRRQLKLAASLGLKWFDNAAEAQTAVREIIGNARRAFTVIDPYFGPEEVRNFAAAVTAGDVSIRIVTSEECLRRAPEDGSEPIASAMENILSNFVDLGWAKPEVLVMRGRHAPLHDRFLIADGRVWLSGNSLNAIGKRASVLIELPNPQEVLNHLGPIIAGAEPFAAWLSKHRSNTSDSDQLEDSAEHPSEET